MNGELEYTVRDVLETRFAMKEPEQDFLVNFLKERGIRKGSVSLHSAFSVEDYLVVIVEKGGARRRLFYHPDNKRIEE
jgi:hypothetical protein